MISSSSTSSHDMWLSLKLNQPAPPSSSLQLVSPHLCHAAFRSSPTHSFLFLPSSDSIFVCNFPSFEALQPLPSSSSPPLPHDFFVSCHILRLTTLLLTRP